MHRKQENLTETHTTPMVSEIHTKQSTKEENSSLFINSILQKSKNKGRTSSLKYLKIRSRKLQRNCTFMNSISSGYRLLKSPPYGPAAHYTSSEPYSKYDLFPHFLQFGVIRQSQLAQTMMSSKQIGNLLRFFVLLKTIILIKITEQHGLMPISTALING